MGLNLSKGNMYPWINYTWNTIKGACHHNCSYCYMKRWGKQKPIRFDEKELREFDRDMKKYGEGQFIFVGSSCDMWANNIPNEWTVRTLNHCAKYDNKYLFQTKNPANIQRILIPNSHVCVTLESNRWYPKIMQNSPKPIDRAEQMTLIRHPLYITIEPIIDFDLIPFVEMIKQCNPIQINIGGDSVGNNLPEPSTEKLKQLIMELELNNSYKVVLKKNLKRLLKN